MHAMLNVMKRLVVVVAAALLISTHLTSLQLVGLVTANVCTAFLSISKPSDKAEVVTDTAEQLPAGECCGHKPSRGLQHTPPSSSQVMTRLARLSAVVLTTCAVCLAAVLAALMQARTNTPPVLVQPVSYGSSQNGISSQAPVWTASQFIMRDARRLQCLRDLHNASRVRQQQ